MAEMEITRLLTTAETAEKLRRTPNALRWMVHAGTAPASALIGGRRMFKAADVQAYIDEAFAKESA